MKKMFGAALLVLLMMIGCSPYAPKEETDFLGGSYYYYDRDAFEIGITEVAKMEQRDYLLFDLERLAEQRSITDYAYTFTQKDNLADSSQIDTASPAMRVMQIMKTDNKSWQPYAYVIFYSDGENTGVFREQYLNKLRMDYAYDSLKTDESFSFEEEEQNRGSLTRGFIRELADGLSDNEHTGNYTIRNYTVSFDGLIVGKLDFLYPKGMAEDNVSEYHFNEMLGLSYPNYDFIRYPKPDAVNFSDYELLPEGPEFLPNVPNAFSFPPSLSGQLEDQRLNFYEVQFSTETYDYYVCAFMKKETAEAVYEYYSHATDTFISPLKDVDGSVYRYFLSYCYGQESESVKWVKISSSRPVPNVIEGYLPVAVLIVKDALIIKDVLSGADVSTSLTCYLGQRFVRGIDGYLKPYRNLYPKYEKGTIYEDINGYYSGRSEMISTHATLEDITNASTFNEVFEEYYIDFLDYGFEITDFNNQKVIPLKNDDIAWTDELDQYGMVYGEDDHGHLLYVYPCSEIMRLMKIYRMGLE